MKRTIIIFSCLASIFVSGCKKEIKTDGMAQLILTLSSEGEFADAGALASANSFMPDVKTKAEAGVDINEFSLRIYDASGESQVLGWDRFSDVPSVIALDPGSYIVKAKSPGEKKVAWSQPIYAGSQNVAVEAGKTQNISLVCTIANMKVTVRCTEKFLSEMNPDFVVSVSSKDGVIDFNSEVIAEGRAAYFDVAPLTLDVRATRKTGAEVNHHVEITDVAPKDHHVFTIDASETGYVDLGTNGISIDYSVNGKEQDITIDGIEENPVDEEPVVPILNSTSIADGSQDVALGTQSVDFVYSVPVKLSDNAVVTVNETPVTASVSGTKVIVPLGTLAASTLYSVNVTAGAVLNNADGTPAEAASLTFTTAAEQPAESIIIECPGVESPAEYKASELPQGASVEFTLRAKVDNGIDKFILSVESEALKGLVSGVEQNENVDLANMSESEIAFWGTLFGITDPSTQVKGVTDYSLSVGKFIPLINQFAGVGKHVMSVEIHDAAGNVKKVTITIIITEG